MNRLVPIGRAFYACALVAFGIQQFVFGEFVVGRAPAWPVGVPGQVVWAYLSGMVLIAAGLAIVFEVKARLAGIVAAALIFVWALVRHVPEVAADGGFGGAWTSAGKALALFGGAVAIVGLESGEGASGRMLQISRLCLGAFLVLCGIQHFHFPDFVAQLVPSWIPGAYFWTYFTGVALFAGGLGLVAPWTASLAAALSGVMVFLWFVLLHVPRALAAPPANSRNEWTAVVEAFAVSGIAFMLAGGRPARVKSERSNPPSLLGRSEVADGGTVEHATPRVEA